MCLTFFQPYTVAASAQIISLNITKGTITEVFKAIEDQSEYKFFYNDNQINLNKRVDVNIHEESIEQVLNNVFRGTDITYKIVKNHVVLTNKTMKDTELPSTNQNRKRLTGQVVGQDGEPLIGVNVVVKGTTIGFNRSCFSSKRRRDLEPTASQRRRRLARKSSRCNHNI